MNVVKRSHLLVRLIILILSVAGLILFYALKGNGNLTHWISQNMEFAIVYLLFFIGLNVPVYKIFFGFYWKYSYNNKNRFIFNKQYFIINILIFIAAVICFILSAATSASNFSFAAVLIVIAQFGLNERVIFKNGGSNSNSNYNNYYASDISFTPKKINSIDFLKNRRQTISMVSIGISGINDKNDKKDKNGKEDKKDKNSKNDGKTAKTVVLPVSASEAEEIQKILL